MAITCNRCSRVNPPDAQYCYFDGAILGGQGNQGPVNMATLPFPMPFVFPSGRVCQNFDQLAIACFEESKAAVESLKQGDLAGFLGGIGRSDLARAAREAAQAPDLNRGLDDLLAKLPSAILKPPRLAVEPTEVNLGDVKIGEDRKLSINLSNQGMRLLYGTISCKDLWLSLGDAGGSQQKLFEFKTDLSIPVHVRGKRLVARPKPYEAKILVDSNGGAVEITLRLNVTVKPFPDGALAGAISPRQIAEKAKAKPKEAALFFENGAVARWYKENGWDYPVKGPASSGLAAIQQYYEAHGLAKAPKVGLNQNQVVLEGSPGENVRHQLEVRTTEKRSVYALAACDKSWMSIEQTPPRGQMAPVILLVNVPNRPGETLHGKVAIRANGNQQFVVPVTLTVNGKRSAAAAVPAGVAAGGVGGGGGGGGFGGGGGGGMDRKLLQGLADSPVTARPYVASAPIPMQPLAQPRFSPPAPALDDGSDYSVPRSKKKKGVMKHLIPLLLLLLPVGVVCLHDFLVKGEAAIIENDSEGPADLRPRVALRMQDQNHRYPQAVDPQGILGSTMRFGLIMTMAMDPSDHSKYKRLTYHERGLTNNTVVRVDKDDVIFGQTPGVWKDAWQGLPKDSTGREPDGGKSSWNPGPASKVLVTQMVEVVAGQSNLLDTCQVRYDLENQDSVSHNVGLRFMLDTFIGAQDGVPFTIPGMKGLVDTMYDFKTPGEVPTFIQALENSDLANPGTIALVQFRVGAALEPPSRVTLGAWPDPKIGEAVYGAGAQDNPLNHFRQFMTMWDVPLVSMQKMKDVSPTNKADSCVVMYWPERELKPGEKRTVGFSYGLGVVVAGGKLAVSAGGSFEPEGEFNVTAQVSDPVAGQNVTIQLPPGLTLVGGNENPANQPVPAVVENSTRHISIITWKVKSRTDGTYVIPVELETPGVGAEPAKKSKATIKIRIQKKAGLI